MLKKINKYIVIAVVFFMMFIVRVDASNIVDFSKKGSIEITLEENKNHTGIGNAEITIYKIANATSKNNNLAFEYIEELSNCSVSLENLEEPSLSKEISKCAWRTRSYRFRRRTAYAGGIHCGAF